MKVSKPTKVSGINEDNKKVNDVNALFNSKRRGASSKAIANKLNKTKALHNSKSGTVLDSTKSLRYNRAKSDGSVTSINKRLNKVSKSTYSNNDDLLAKSKHSNSKSNNGRTSAKNALSKLFFRKRSQIKTILLNNNISHARIRVTVTVRNAKIVNVYTSSRYKMLNSELKLLLVGQRVGGSSFNGTLFHTIVASS
ncbi:hypothetical protein [Photobacterium damselae]|uniref:hypothetical protein n=1 Tax=Photobacterium damselae TaxID=38293 RepID=UPI0040677652